MPTNFLSLPGELRNKIYNHVLVREEPVQLWYNGHELVPTLLAANRTILNEASSLLYGYNCFDLAASNFQLVSEFLNRIGRRNASLLQRLRIDFPILRDLEDDPSFEEDSSHTLAKIQSDCINLTTLILSADSTYAFELKLDAFDSPKIVAKALDLVDARFQAILPLREIVAEVYEDGPSDDIRRRMEGRGWIIKLVQRELESDRELSDYYEEDYLVDDYDDDEYDIDNDSDFWRRAAD